MPSPPAATVYLEAHYPHTSLGFLIPSLLLFMALTVAAWLTLWPVAIPFILVTLYLLRFTLRQARGRTLAIRVTDRVIYHHGWQSRPFRAGLPGGELPLHAIGGVDLVKLRSVAAGGPVVAIWLSDPEAWRPARGPHRWAREMAAAGDLAISCDETDRTAEQVREAIEAALAENS